MAAQRYYRTPQAVDAIQYDGDNLAELDEWIDPGYFDFNPDIPANSDGRASVLTTEHSVWQSLYPGNWVISWGDDEYAVLTDDQFQATYSQDGA